MGGHTMKARADGETHFSQNGDLAEFETCVWWRAWGFLEVMIIGHNANFPTDLFGFPWEGFAPPGLLYGFPCMFFQ